MDMRSGWTNIVCFVLAGVLVATWLFPPDFIVTWQFPRVTTVVVVIEEEPDPSIVDLITFKGFDEYEEARLREALRAKFTRRCGEAFNAAGLPSPASVILNSGLVIRHANDLWLKEISALGLVYEETKMEYRSQFSSGRAQAGTVPYMRGGWRLTVDGKARLFIHDSSFFGASFVDRRFDLEDCLSHELVHMSGMPETPGWFGFLRHDLAGFEPHDRILAACR